ncbi:MAG: ammonium transporter [Sphingobacteriales bacterium]|nr:MAG: ammonium transporter [Sphingobacteriales bacterium]
MKRKGLLMILLAVLALSACIKDSFIPLPDYDVANLANTTPVDTAYKAQFEGVYALLDGDERFGRQFVAKWANGYLCFFSESDGKFLNMQVGYNAADSSFRMAGFWYDPLQPQDGHVQFTMARADGVDSVFAHKSINPLVTSNGLFFGETKLFLVQAGALIGVSVFAFGGTLLLLKLTNALVPMRVSDEEERKGLDLSQHGERL